MAGVFFSCAFRDFRIISFLSPQDIFLLISFFPLYFGWSNSFKGSKLNFYLISAIFLFFLLILNSLLVSENSTESIFNYLKVFVAFVILPLVIRFYVQDFIEIYFLLHAYLFGALISCSVTLFLEFGESNNGRASGFTGHPVFFGIMIATCIMIALTMGYRTPKRRILNFIYIAFLLYSLSLSASSTGLVIILTGTGALLILNLLQGKILTSIGSALSVVLIGILVWNADFFDYTRSRLLVSLNPQTGFNTSGASGTSTLEARVISVEYGWERIKESPLFGHGLDALGRQTSINLEPHNMIVLAWQAGGIVLLVLSIIFLAISIKYLILAVRKRLALGIVVILATWLGLMTQPLIYERSVLAPLFLVFAALNLLKVENTKT